MNPKNPASTNPVTLAKAPLSPKRVNATWSSAGSKIARINLKAEGIYEDISIFPTRRGGGWPTVAAPKIPLMALNT
jgi:hypothetical protein